MRITTATAKVHLRVDAGDEDTVIGIMVSAAARRIEAYIGIPLTARDEVFKFSKFGDFLEIGKRPLNSVDNIAYVDTDGSAQTFDAHRIVGEKVYPNVGSSFPATLNPSEIVVTANVGWIEGGDDEDEVPPSVLQAQLLLIGHYYEHKEAVISGTIASVLPEGVKSLLQEFRRDLA